MSDSSLVFGILGLVVCIFAFVVYKWVLPSIKEEKKVKQKPNDKYIDESNFGSDFIDAISAIGKGINVRTLTSLIMPIVGLGIVFMVGKMVFKQVEVVAQSQTNVSMMPVLTTAFSSMGGFSIVIFVTAGFIIISTLGKMLR